MGRAYIKIKTRSSNRPPQFSMDTPQAGLRACELTLRIDAFPCYTQWRMSVHYSLTVAGAALEL
jgi:hypothetical protein